MPERDSISSRLSWLAGHAEAGLTGRVSVEDAGPERRAHLYLRDGLLYSVQVVGYRVPVVIRLRTAGIISHRQCQNLVRAVNGDYRHPALAQHAISSGIADADVVRAVHREALLSSLATIATWPKPRTRATEAEDTTITVIPPITIAAVLAALTRREQHWDTIWADMTGPGEDRHRQVPFRTETLPVVSDLTPDGQALLGRVNGFSTVDDIAGDLGMTRFETGHLLHTLWTANLISFRPVGMTATAEPEQDQPEMDAPTPVAPVLVATTPDFDPDPVTTPDGKPQTFTMTPEATAALDEAAANVSRLRATLSDARQTANRARRAREAAEIEEVAARDALLHAQTVAEQAASRTALARRSENDSVDRADAAQRDLDRAEEVLEAIERAPRTDLTVPISRA